MLELKNKAFLLRKLGKSYRIISSELGVPISTLSLWLSDQVWSKEIGQSLKSESSQKGSTRLAAARKAKGFGLQFAYAKAKQDAEQEYKKLKKNSLFIAGLTLYWALGDKSSAYYIRLSTSDVQKMALYKAFLDNVFNVEQGKVHYSLLLSPTLNEFEAKNEWSDKAKIPLHSFTKSTVRRLKRSTKEYISSVCNATLSSRYHKEKMLVWLRLLANEFLSQ